MNYRDGEERIDLKASDAVCVTCGKPAKEVCAFCEDQICRHHRLISMHAFEGNAIECCCFKPECEKKANEYYGEALTASRCVFSACICCCLGSIGLIVLSIVLTTG